ncbi:MAG: hypothetical protein QOE58_162, partial [Actinomycetota bacterium]|nr:hypothetical protein [Actinomycetota bacterium]
MRRRNSCPRSHDADDTARHVSTRQVLVLAVVSFMGSCLLLWPQHGRVLDWDEVDYVSAAKRGVAANLFEVGSLSLGDYGRFAWAKLHGVPVSLPPSYNERSDPLLLRHFHPPAVPVSMAAIATVRGERSIRAVQLAGAAALMAVVTWAYLLTSPKPSLYGVVPLLLAVAWISWHLYGYLQFHGWETVWMVLVGVSVLQWIRKDHERFWAMSICFSLTLAIVTLEAGVLLLAPVALCVILSTRASGVRSPRVWLRRYLLPGLFVVV